MALEEAEILPLSEKYITATEWKELVAHAMGARRPSVDRNCTLVRWEPFEQENGVVNEQAVVARASWQR
ncbi:hypothetical protein [Nocardia alni]|uniref:hypothetical protein n=1 Tax=Nocardia alni TaxID=2815723 RepID=UPI001C21D146|nr:hypothetical protein [Nocardia alni]